MGVQLVMRLPLSALHLVKRFLFFLYSAFEDQKINIATLLPENGIASFNPLFFYLPRDSPESFFNLFYSLFHALDKNKTSSCYAISIICLAFVISVQEDLFAEQGDLFYEQEDLFSMPEDLYSDQSFGRINPFSDRINLLSERENLLFDRSSLFSEREHLFLLHRFPLYIYVLPLSSLPSARHQHHITSTFAENTASTAFV